MRIDFDARVKTADGHDAGHVRRALIDPAAQRVTGFVVGTGGLLEREVIVGEDDFVPDSPEGDALVLRLSRQELEAQPTFEQAISLRHPPVGRRPWDTASPRTRISCRSTPLPISFPSRSGRHSRKATS